MDGYNTYSGGMAVGVKPFVQSGRTQEFFSGATTTNISPNRSQTLQQNSLTGFQPSSVLSSLPSANGQSSITAERNRALNLNRQ